MSKQKETKEEKIMLCRICHLRINHTEDYCKLIQYKKGLEFSTGYYHVVCYQKRLGGDPQMKEIQSMAKGILQEAKIRMGAI